MSSFYSSERQGYAPHHNIPLLHAFSAHQIAQLIRALDSKLISIEYAEQHAHHILIYTFEIAGKSQIFHISLTTNVLDSIAHLYPNAAIYEQALQEQTPLIFRQPTT